MASLTRSRLGIPATVALLALVQCGSGETLTSPEQPPAPIDSLVAFVGADVVSMLTPTIARGQTVLIRNGVIAAIGSSNALAVPTGARRIESQGKYLMPGLTDFHVHIAERGDLPQYVAAGVTTAVHMGGSGPTVVAWRDSVRAGTLIGPDIYVGSFLNGPLGRGGPMTVQTTPDAVEYVRAAARGHFDFIKVYNSLTEEQFLAAAAEAKQVGLPLLGHSVRSVGLQRGFAQGQRVVVHAEEYLYDGLASQDESLLPGAVAFTKSNDVALVPNLSAYDVIGRQWGRPAVVDSILATPEGRRLSPYWVQRWRNADYVRRSGSLEGLPYLVRLTVAMQRGGVPILLGTDSPTIPGLFAGTSIHHDLRLLVQAGLSPYEALKAGTINAGEFARREFRAERFGAIAEGYRADLLLLSANPLEDVARVRVPLGVMARGRWLPASQ